MKFHLPLWFKRQKLRFFQKQHWVFHVFAGYILLLTVFSIIGDRGLWASYRVWRVYSNLRTHNVRLQSDIDQLEKDVASFKGDLRTIEKYAREEFNMRGEMESQIIFK